MRETGRVTKINGSLVTVSCRPSDSCRGCGNVLCGGRGREITARNPRNFPLREGDYAELSLPSSRAVAAGLRVFGLPVAAFVGFFLGAGPVLQTTTEAPRVLAGLAGSLLAAGAAFAWGRLRPALPEIIRAVDDVDTKGA